MLAGQIEQGKELKLSAHDVNSIEKALIENDAYDVAKSLVLSRQQRDNTEERLPVSIRLIRRNGKVVPWNEGEDEIAITILSRSN